MSDRDILPRDLETDPSILETEVDEVEIALTDVDMEFNDAEDWQPLVRPVSITTERAVRIWSEDFDPIVLRMDKCPCSIDIFFAYCYRKTLVCNRTKKFSTNNLGGRDNWAQRGASNF